MPIGNDDAPIKDWGERRLSRYIVRMIENTPPNLPPSVLAPEVHSTRRLVVGDQLELSPQAIEYLKSVLGIT